MVLQVPSFKQSLKFIISLVAFCVFLGNFSGWQPCISGALAATGGSISGTVVNGASEAVSGVSVMAYDPWGGGSGGGAITGADGTYTITGLNNGAYKILFSPTNQYASQFYNNKILFREAALVPVVVGSTTTDINATLNLGGTITGKVTNSLSEGIGSISVYAYDYATGAHVGHAATSVDGTYTINNLPAGNYKVFFTSVSYLPKYFNDKSIPSTADPVTVVAGNTTSDINVTLTATEPRGGISGTIKNGGGIGISGVTVLAYNATTGVTAGNATSSNGAYAITGLPSGNYKIRFSANSTGYVSQYFDSKNTFTSGTSVLVTAGNTTIGIDVTLETGGIIAGTVSDATSSNIGSFSVSAYDATTNLSVGIASVNSTTGSYSISGLPSGNYKLRFTPTLTSYSITWYNSKTSQTAADSVAVTAGTTTSEINVTMLPSGSISGQVTDGVSGIPGIQVYAFNSRDELVTSNVTDAAGNYSFTRLPEGSYKIRFQEKPSQSGYYAIGYALKVYSNPDVNAVNMSQGTLIPVSASSPATGIDAVLLKNTGSISGAITDAITELPIKTCTVRVIDSNGNFINSASSDIDGAYTVKGVPTGTHKVEFLCAGRYANQWYPSKGDFASASTVSVAAPADTPQINASLIAGTGIYLPVVVRDFGLTRVNTSSKSVLNVTNFSTLDLAIGNLSITGTDFTLLSDECSGVTLPVSGSCTILVSFSPTSNGEKNGSVIIPSNASNTAPVSIPIKGTGIMAPSYTIRSSVSGGIGDINCTPTVSQGDNAICDISPAKNYHLTSLSDNGVEKFDVVTSGVYNLNNVNADHEIISTFAPDLFALTVKVFGSGSGSISSKPQGISCSTGTCSNNFQYGQLVSLYNTSNNVSSFGEWGGSCSGPGDCSITIDGPKDVTATFNLTPKAMNVTTGTPYPTLLTALTEAKDGAEIQILDTQFDGVIVIDKSLTLHGGRNTFFNAWSGLPSVFNDGLTVDKGISTAENIDIISKLSVLNGSLKVIGVRVR